MINQSAFSKLRWALYGLVSGWLLGLLWWIVITIAFALSDGETIVGGLFGTAVIFASRYPMSPRVAMPWGTLGLLVGFLSSLCRDARVPKAAIVGMIIGALYALVFNSWDGSLALNMPASCFSGGFVGLLLGVFFGAKVDISKVKQSAPNDPRMEEFQQPMPGNAAILSRGGSSQSFYPNTFAFLAVLVVIAAILEVLPFDRPEGNNFVVAIKTQIGFPLVYASMGLGSTDVNLAAFVADILAVGGIIVVLTCWWQRWITSHETHPAHHLHPETWIFLSATILGGIFLEVFPFTYEYTDHERMNLPDNLPGNHWLGKGVPFAYSRIDSAESLDPRPPGRDAPSRITFDSAILVFDFLILALAIAETTYWFDKWPERTG